MGRGRKQSERTLKMVENFMTHHENGDSIKEIAEKYDLSEKTVREYLPEIAQKGGVSRESLLERVHKPHVFTNNMSRQMEHFRFEESEIEQHAAAIRKEMNELQGAIRSFINGQEIAE